jgi:ubiquinone/menaquinone biosynthesis C-methylase UbiE
MKKITYGQAGKPSGFIGKLIGKIMSKVNNKEIPATLSRLSLKSNDRVLEIGFGPGKSFQALAEIIKEGKIVGIDHSETMLQMASGSNKQLIADGKLDLQLGNADDLNFEKGSFDKVFTINCIYFWKTPLKSLQKIHEMLNIGGILAITVRDSTHGLNKHYTVESLNQLLVDSDYMDIKVEKLAKEKLIIATGRKSN